MSKRKATSSPLEGMVISITGTLSVLRAEFESFITSHGGSTSSSVTNKTTHLVSAERGTKKCEDAQSRGIMIVDEAFVRSLVDSGGGGGVYDPDIQFIENSFYSNQNPYADVWEVITKPENAIDSDVLLTKLIALGASRCDQLQYLEEQDVKDIAAMLKIIPKREFVSKFEAAVLADAFAASSGPPTKKAATQNQKSSSSSSSSSSSGGAHLAAGEKCQFESSSKAGTFYEVKNHGDHCSCSCPAWKFQGGSPKTRRPCTHIKQLVTEGRVSAEDMNMEVESDEDDEKTVKAPVKVKAPPLKLAEKYEEKVNPVGWWMSEKYDGVRTFWDGHLFYSRLGNVFNAPEYFKTNLPADGLTLDGELWTGRGKFNETVGIAKTQLDAGWRRMKFLVFDAPSLDMVFEERQRFLKNYFEKHPNDFVELVAQKKCESKGDLEEMLRRVEATRGEGVMLVKPNTKYVGKRSKDLLKVKTFHDCEATIIGYNAGKGINTGSVGSFQVRLASGKQCGVGSGLTMDMRSNPPEIGTEITIRYQELSEDGVPRFPTFVRIAPVL